VSSPPDTYMPSSSGRFAYPVRVPKSRGSGPWAIASFIAIPLFFASLMCSALAQERPYVIQWKGCAHGICTTWREPTSANEAAIWLWALVPPLVLVLVGYFCTRVPYGWYVACVAGIVEAIAVTHRLNTWTLHHTRRYPWGVDLIPSTNASSNQWDPGEWERMARATALSLSHWTIGVAVLAIVVMAAVETRRRFFSRQPFPLTDEDVLEGVHAPSATGAGIPSE
jgi:hypothetical protein